MLRKYGRAKHNTFEFTFYKVMAIILFLLGLASFTLEMMANIQNLKGEGAQEESSNNVKVPEVPNP